MKVSKLMLTNTITTTELNRKLIHLTSLIYPVLYLAWLDKTMMVWFMLGLTSLVWSSELLRRTVPPFKRLYLFLFGSSLRTHELHKPAGASYFLIGATLTIILFDPIISALAVCVLVISDTVASLAGQKWGKVKLFGQKSWVGSLGFFASAVVLSGAFYGYYPLLFWSLLIASVVATLLELFQSVFQLDDKILIPLGFAATATFSASFSTNIPQY